MQFSSAGNGAITQLLGEEAQKLLKELRFLIVGLGGLGSFVATELVYLGAQKLILVDNDRVSRSNLNRQILYGIHDVGKSKVLVASRRLKEINPFISVETFDTKLTKMNANYLVDKADVVIDCSDNFETKRLLNRVCFNKRKMLISGAVGSWEGWVASFPFYKDEDVSCLECLFPGDLETLKEITEPAGQTLVTTVGAVATFQVNEVIKLISGQGENLEGKTLIIDTKTNQCAVVKLTKNPQCPVCSSSPSE